MHILKLLFFISVFFLGILNANYSQRNVLLQDTKTIDIGTTDPIPPSSIKVPKAWVDIQAEIIQVASSPLLKEREETQYKCEEGKYGVENCSYNQVNCSSFVQYNAGNSIEHQAIQTIPTVKEKFKVDEFNHDNLRYGITFDTSDLDLYAYGYDSEGNRIRQLGYPSSDRGFPGCSLSEWSNYYGATHSADNTSGGYEEINIPVERWKNDGVVTVAFLVYSYRHQAFDNLKAKAYFYDSFNRKIEFDLTGNVENKTLMIFHLDTKKVSDLDSAVIIPDVDIYTCPDGFKRIDNGDRYHSGTCKRDYIYYDYNCDLPDRPIRDSNGNIITWDTSNHDGEWQGPLISNGGDCKGENLINGKYCQSKIPPAHNCLREYHTCPSDSNKKCSLLYSGSNSKSNVDGKFIYQKGNATTYKKTITKEKGCDDPRLSYDEITGMCVMSADIMCKNGGFVYNKNTGQCESILNCVGGEIDQTTGECIVDAIHNCPDGFDYSYSAKKCVKPIVCEDGSSFNSTTLKCEKRITDSNCPSGWVYNEGRNKCEQDLTTKAPYDLKAFDASTLKYAVKWSSKDIDVYAVGYDSNNKVKYDVGYHYSGSVWSVNGTQIHSGDKTSGGEEIITIPVQDWKNLGVHKVVFRVHAYTSGTKLQDYGAKAYFYDSRNIKREFDLIGNVEWKDLMTFNLDTYKITNIDDTVDIHEDDLSVCDDGYKKNNEYNICYIESDYSDAEYDFDLKKVYITPTCSAGYTLYQNKCVKDVICSDGSSINTSLYMCEIQDDKVCPKGSNFNSKKLCVKELICPNGSYKSSDGKSCIGETTLSCPENLILNSRKGVCETISKCPKNYRESTDGKCYKEYEWSRYTCPDGWEGPAKPGRDCLGECGNFGCSCNPSIPMDNNCRKPLNQVLSDKKIITKVPYVKHKVKGSMIPDEFGKIKGYRCDTKNCKFRVKKITGKGNELCFTKVNNRTHCFNIDNCSFDGVIENKEGIRELEIGHLNSVPNLINTIVIESSSDHGIDYGESKAISNFKDFDNAWKREGVDITTMALKISGEWYSLDGVGGLKSLSRKNIRILEPSSICNHSNTATNNCGLRIMVKIPNGKRLEAYSDIETINNVFTSDNSFDENLTFYNIFQPQATINKTRKGHGNIGSIDLSKDSIVAPDNTISCYSDTTIYSSTLKSCTMSNKLKLSNWNVYGADANWEFTHNGTVGLQKYNTSQDTFLLHPDTFDGDVEIEGHIRVVQKDYQIWQDNDWIGMVFGYKSDSDYYAFTWTKNKDGWHNGGMNLIYATSNNSHPERSGKILSTNYGSDKGWVDLQNYKIKLVYNKRDIKIFIDDVEVLSYHSDKDLDISGKVGFFGFSQHYVEYSDFMLKTSPKCPAGFIYYKNEKACLKKSDETFIDRLKNQRGLYQYELREAMTVPKPKVANPNDISCWTDSTKYDPKNKSCVIKNNALDLRTWNIAGQSDAKWEFQNNGKFGYQRVNTNKPTLLLHPDNFGEEIDLKGHIKVIDTGDNDWIGIVFGYKSDSDYYAFTWTKNKDGWHNEGYTLSHITSNTNYNPESNALKAVFGTGKGWKPNTEYTFRIKYSKGYIAAYINDKKVVEYTDPNLTISGKVGFYGWSQKDVQYWDLFLESSPKCPSNYFYQASTKQCLQRVKAQSTGSIYSTCKMNGHVGWYNLTNGIISAMPGDKVDLKRDYGMNEIYDSNVTFDKSQRIEFWDSYTDGYLGFLEFVDDVKAEDREKGFKPKNDIAYALGEYGFTAIQDANGYTYYVSSDNIPGDMSDKECDEYASEFGLERIDGKDNAIDKALVKILSGDRGYTKILSPICSMGNYNPLTKQCDNSEGQGFAYCINGIEDINGDCVIQKRCVLKGVGSQVFNDSDYAYKIIYKDGEEVFKCSPYSCEDGNCKVERCPTGFQPTKLPSTINTNGKCIKDECDGHKPYVEVCGKGNLCPKGEEYLPNKTAPCYKYYCPEGQFDSNTKTCKVYKCPDNTEYDSASGFCIKLKTKN